MTTAELEERIGRKVPPKWAVVLAGESAFWRQSDGSWVDYEEERGERQQRRDSTRDDAA